MSEETKIYCPFAINDNFGIMSYEVKPSANCIEIKRPIFSNEGFKIKTSFSGKISSYNLGYLYTNGLANSTGKKYNKQYRREVLWDFGDGTKKMGYSVEHYYKKPGRYCITCTFFDINRKGYKNSFCAYVIVKELIPTQLSFVKQFTSSDGTKTVYTKSNISCSKIERIARMECLVSNTVDKEFDVFVKRTDDTTHPSYFDLKDNGNLHETRYWTTLRNEQLLYYRTNQVYSNWLQPSDTFIPNYSKLYYRLTYNSEAGERDFEFYQVIPYKDIDDILNKITVLNPNGDVRQKASTKTYKIIQKYTQEQLPSDAIYCGLRGFVDIFYKNDVVNESSDFSIFYDIETDNITGELKSSANYLNINPLGLTVKTKANSLDKVKLAASGNYFLKEVEGGAKLTDKDKVYIDPYFEGSLYKGVNLTCYVFPFCTYEGEEVIMLDSSYYVPKDINLSIKYEQIDDKEFESGTNSKVNSATDYLNKSDMWLKKIELELNNYIDLEIDGTINGGENNEESRVIKIVQKPLLNIENISIPKEKQSKVDIDRLLQSYMIHPMFSETSVLKDFVKAYLKTFIQKTTTHSNNFIDNVANSKTCYLSNLIAQLKMMGDDVTEYEYTNFDGINDLKKFARLLSMNHSDLVGHTREKDWDVYIIKDNKGANVGDVISLDSKITLDVTLATNVGDEETYGKIWKIGDEPVSYEDGVDLIVHDKYTNDVKMVNFRTYLKKYRNNEVYLKDYKEDWGWNLLLPENFGVLNEKIAFYEQKAKNKAYAKSQIVSFEKEAERLKQKKRDLIDGYYDFHVLIPKKEVERVGHFLEEEDITSKIESVKEWKSDWGIAHDVLMKILLSNGLMTSERDFEDYQGNLLWETVLINESKTFNRGEISTTIYVENEVGEYEVKGTVTIRGKIFAEGENTLYVTLSDGVIDNKDGFEIQNDASITIVVQGRNIKGETFKIPLTGKRLKENSNLIIKISENSTIDNPDVKVEANIYYDPAVVSGYITCSADKNDKGVIYNKTDNNIDNNFKGYEITHEISVAVNNGFVEGVGVNSVPLSFSGFNVTQKPYENDIQTDEINNVNFDLSDPRLTFEVDDDGNITHDGETFTFNGKFSNYLTIKEGTMEVKIGGTVKQPTLEIVSCKIDYYYDYPQLLQSYNLSDFSSKVSLTNGNEETLTFDERLGELITNAILAVHPVEISIETEDNYIILLDDNNAIDVKQLSEFVTETTNLKTFINDFSLSLTRNDEETTIVGEDKYYTCLISGKYNIESYDEWILEPIESLVSGEVTITKFGDVGGELTLDINSDKIINSSIELTFKVSGDICRGNATLEIVTNKEPRCIYVKTFYLNETFYTKGQNELIVGDAVRIKGFQDVDKVNVRFTDSLKDDITTITSTADDSVEETNGKYLIIEVYNENITPEHEQIDGETGEVVLVPETISKEIIYNQVFEVDDSSVNVNENGEITWDGMEVTPIYTTDYERVLIDSNISKLSINSNNFGIKEFVLEGKIKDYTNFDGSISLSSTEDKAEVESVQRTFNGYCDVTVSGKGVLWDDRDTDVNLTLEYRPKVEVTNKKTGKTSNVYISPLQVTKTVTVDKDGLIKIDGGLPTIEINFEHFDEDEVPGDEYDEEGNLKESDTEIEDEYDEQGNLIPKPEAIDDGDFNYTLSGSLSMSGNVQNVRFKELLENLFTITVVDTSFSFSSSQDWDNTKHPNVTGGYTVNVNGKIKKNFEDSYADITITNINFNIDDCDISEADIQSHVKFNENYTIENTTEFNVFKTENHVDYDIVGNITVTIEHEDDQDADNYGPDLSVTNEITKADRIDRNFTEITEEFSWVEKDESFGSFTVEASGWRKGETEDGYLELNVIPKSIVFKDTNGNVVHQGNISESQSASEVLVDTEQNVGFVFDYIYTESHVDYSFGANVTITIFSADEYIDEIPKINVVTNNVDFKITDRNFTPTYESFYWDNNNTSYGQFSVTSDGWKQGEAEDGELNLTVTPISVVFDDGTDVGKSIQTVNKKIVLNGEETDTSFTFKYEETVNNVDYRFIATVTITPSLTVTTNNVVCERIDKNFTINKTYNWDDFTIDGVDETTNLVGGFNIKVENGVCGSSENEFTITINETTVDGQILSGTTTYNWMWAVQQNGEIIHNTPHIEGETIPFNLTNADGTTLSGEIIISGNVKNGIDVELKSAKLVKTKTINQSYKWETYTTNIDQIETISGGFNIVGSWKSNQNTIQLTMKINDTTINGNGMSGVKTIPLVVSSTNSNGSITPPTSGFTSFSLSDTEGNIFSGEIIVKGTVDKPLVSMRNVKYVSTVEVYKEIDYDGNVISYNTKGLENGREMYVWSGITTYDPSINGDLTKLTNGYDMFRGCPLDFTSVQKIFNQLQKNPNSFTIQIDADRQFEEKIKSELGVENGRKYINDKIYCQTIFL